MKIRTITTGCTLKVENMEEQIKHHAKMTQEIKKIFEQKGYDVQTTRITTQPWETYFKSKKQIDFKLCRTTSEAC